MLLPIARVLVLVQTVALLLGLVGAAMLLWTATKFNAASVWVEHTHEVLDDITALRTEALRGGIALRNYTIAPDLTYLEAARVAGHKATEAAARMEQRVQDNALQASRAFALRAETAELVGWMLSSAVIGERDGPAALLASLKPRVSLDASRGLRQQLLDMESTERSLLQARTEQRETEYTRLIAGAAVGGLGVIAFLVWSVAYAASLFRRSKANIQILRDSADTDPLTGLLNRRGLERRFAHLQGSPLTLVTFDLDDFKPVNDIHGHPAGDEVLRFTAQRLLRECRDHDLVGRFGGDEFVIVLTEVTSSRTAEAFCNRLKQALSEPISLGGITVQVGASFGHRVSQGGVPLGQLLAQADEAAYAEKSLRKSNKQTHPVL